MKKILILLFLLIHLIGLGQNFIDVIGDSQSDPRAPYGVSPGNMWPSQLCDMLNKAGANVKPRVFGVSGNTSTQALARADIINFYSRSALVAIAIGVNDPGASISNATTQANIQALCKVAKYDVHGYGAGLGLGVTVATQNDLPANGTSGQRFIVMADNSADGGRPKNHSAQHTTITTNYSSGAVQSVWEFRNQQAGTLGWGRVAINSTPAFIEGTSKILVISTNYLNYVGGDNYNTITSTGTQYTPNVGVRTAQKAAAIAEGAEYVDEYDFESRLIYETGETTQNSSSFHYTNGNQHFAPYGHNCRGRAANQTILLKPGWLLSLSLN